LLLRIRSVQQAAQPFEHHRVLEPKQHDSAFCWLQEHQVTSTADWLLFSAFGQELMTFPEAEASAKLLRMKTLREDDTKQIFR
jgi:hypothetical protein